MMNGSLLDRSSIGSIGSHFKPRPWYKTALKHNHSFLSCSMGEIFFFSKGVRTTTIVRLRFGSSLITVPLSVYRRWHTPRRLPSNAAPGDTHLFSLFHKAAWLTPIIRLRPASTSPVRLLSRTATLSASTSLPIASYYSRWYWSSLSHFSSFAKGL